MMNLKELRISKGLNQDECASYLGMSTRNLQNYENIPEKANTAKYVAVCQKLTAYGSDAVGASGATYVGEYNTNVVTGEGLKSFAVIVTGYKKRDCFNLLQKFISSDVNGKIAIIYGLRRTGKTTLLFQMISELPANQTAYIKIRIKDNMSMLTKDLEMLRSKGCKYVFIDEITLADDFIGTAALLSDIFANMGMKIVVSGTDSLGFMLAGRDELYDRNVMIHTSFIPFGEYSRILGIKSVDEYIEYGGTLKKENMNFDDPDYDFDEVSFRDDESARKYIDTSISRNIQHSLKNDSFGEYFNQLRDLYDKGELTNVINRIVESMNHEFLLSVVEGEFKSHDLGSAKELLLHEYPKDTAHVLYDIDQKKLIERLKNIINIREKQETSIKVTQEHIEKIKKYLFMLDLIASCEDRYENAGASEHIIFTQPGMRYAIAKALVYSLMQDEYFVSQPEGNKKHIEEKILEDVKGRMLEDIVLFETSSCASKSEDVFRFKFDEGGEYDMVIYDKDSDSCKIYEMKHSDKVDEHQTRYLSDEDKLKLIAHRFGEIKGKYVIYRGKSKTVADVQYVNAEEYLKGL